MSSIAPPATTDVSVPPSGPTAEESAGGPDIEGVKRQLRAARFALGASGAWVYLVLDGGDRLCLAASGVSVPGQNEITVPLLAADGFRVGSLVVARAPGGAWAPEEQAGVNDWAWFLGRLLTHATEPPKGPEGRTSTAEFVAPVFAEVAQRLIRAIGQADEGLVLISVSRRIEWINESFLRMLGLAREDVEGYRLPELMARFQTLGAIQDLDAACEMAIDTSYDRMRGRLTGERFWLSISFSVVRDADGAPTHFVAIGRDVTAQRESEFQLRRLSSAVQASSEGIAVLDEHRMFTVVNRAFARLHGYEAPQDLSGTSWFDLVKRWVPDDRALDIEFAVESSNGWTGTFDDRVTGGDRVVHHVITRLGDGGWIMGAHDVTEQATIEQTLLRARDQAEATAQAQANFVTVVSHELRTPLNAIIGFSNILTQRSGHLLAPRDRDYLGRINTSGRTLLGVIDNILTHAKADAGHLQVQARAIDVSLVVREYVGTLALGPANPDIRMGVELPDEPCIARVDPQRVRQILSNLVSNALRFTERGSVTIRLRSALDGGVDLEVEDTGVGIREERFETIFRPFEQGEAGTSRRHDGMGLGLAIVRSLCHLMGLEVRVRSVVGQGSCFTIHLPAHLRCGAVEEPAVQ